MAVYLNSIGSAPRNARIPISTQPRGVDDYAPNMAASPYAAAPAVPPAPAVIPQRAALPVTVPPVAPGPPQPAAAPAPTLALPPVQSASPAMIPVSGTAPAPMQTAALAKKPTTTKSTAAPLETPSWFNPADDRTDSTSGYTAAQLWNAKQAWSKTGKAQLVDGKTIVDAQGNYRGKARDAFNFFSSTPFDANAKKAAEDQAAAVQAGIAKLLFPETSVKPEDISKLDPAYQWQLDQGKKLIDSSLAAKGLANSGAALGADRDFASQLFGTESKDYYQRQQDQANRFLTWISGQQDFSRGTSNDTFNRLVTLLQLQLQQNPIPGAASATSSSAGISNTIAQLMKELPVAAPGLSNTSIQNYLSGLSPNFSGVNSATNSINAADSSNTTNLVNTIVGSLFPK